MIVMNSFTYARMKFRDMWFCFPIDTDAFASDRNLSILVPPKHNRAIQKYLKSHPHNMSEFIRVKLRHSRGVTVYCVYNPQYKAKPKQLNIKRTKIS